jgi:threonine synthase
LIDPHTAVAVNALSQYRKATGDDTLCVVHSTASPFKFPEAMIRALEQGRKSYDMQSYDSISDNEDMRLDLLCEISGRKLPEAIKRLRQETGREPESGYPEEITRRIRHYAFERW